MMKFEGRDVGLEESGNGSRMEAGEKLRVSDEGLEVGELEDQVTMLILAQSGRVECAGNCTQHDRFDLI